jgi:V/A-type H+-transporting ATPase subunit I
VRRSSRPVDAHSVSLLEEVNRYNAAYKLLSKVKTNDAEPDDTQHVHPSHLLQRTEELWAEHRQLVDRRAKLILEIEVSRPWGNWGTEPVDRLKNLNITPHFYITIEKIYIAQSEQWEQEYVVKVINRENGKVYFAVLEVSGEPYSFPLSEARLPVASTAILENELDDIDHRQDTILRKLAKYALQRKRLADHRNELIEKLDIYLAAQGAQSEVADTLSVLTAFVPEPQNTQVEEFLEQEHIVYLQAKATIEDSPPIKLKNNKYSRLFEPVGDMFMPPKYDEMDVTAFFSPFYMLFFGFCLGDMGYGITFILLGTILRWFLPKMKSILGLVQFLGVGSVLMPLLTGTFFGMKLGELFHIEKVFFDDMQLFWSAIVFGALHIIFAKLVHAFDAMKRQGFQHGLAPLGWTLLLIGAGLVSAREFLSLAIPSIVITIVLCLGVALFLFFTSTSKNIFIRIGAGLAALYDVVGIFGDLLSYIRLFGLATAGGILGFVVNTMGIMMFKVPYIGYVLGVLVLIVGHLAVMALSSIGAFVHPMRLTFVEFYKHVGFEGGGRPYKPLTKKSLN